MMTASTAHSLHADRASAAESLWQAALRIWVENCLLALEGGIHD